MGYLSCSGNNYLRVCLKDIYNSMLTFMFQVKYIIAFYLIGDVLTTFIVIENELGFEANKIISSSIEHYGFIILVVIKFMFLLICYLEYLYLKKRRYDMMWNILRYSVSVFGIFVVINNLFVILDLTSPIYVLYSWL